jgi:hypothetical protein
VTLAIAPVVERDPFGLDSSSVSSISSPIDVALNISESYPQ